MQRQGLTGKKHETMIGLLKSGMTVTDVSKFMNVAENYVEEYAPKKEVKEPPKPKPKKRRQRTNTDGNK